MAISYEQREPFMRAIIESPEDDTPRLVFADFLEENGEAIRAQWIRRSCEFCRIYEDNVPSEIPSYYNGIFAFGNKFAPIVRNSHYGTTERLKIAQAIVIQTPERIEELQRENQSVGLTGRLDGWTIDDLNQSKITTERFGYTRGFISAIFCTWQQWMENYVRYTSHFPLQEVFITDRIPNRKTLDRHLQGKYFYTESISLPHHDWSFKYEKIAMEDSGDLIDHVLYYKTLLETWKKGFTYEFPQITFYLSDSDRIHFHVFQNHSYPNYRMSPFQRELQATQIP